MLFLQSILRISLNRAHIINREFNSLQEQVIYFLQIVQTSSGAQATSHSECIGSSFPGAKQPRHAVDRSLHLVQSLSMNGDVLIRLFLQPTLMHSS